MISKYCIVDIETTGLDPTTDKIIEIAIRKHNGDDTESFYSLINPGIDIPPEITKLNGLTNEMLYKQPTFKTISSVIIDFIHGFDLVIYNQKFVISMLLNEFNRCGYVFNFKKNTIVDVQSIWKSEYNPMSLYFATEFMFKNKVETKHNSDVDCTLIDSIYKKMMSDGATILKSKYADVSENIIQTDSDYIFNYGSEKKFRGKSVFDIFRTDLEYYQWLMASDLQIDTKIVLKLLYYNYLKY